MPSTIDNTPNQLQLCAYIYHELHNFKLLFSLSHMTTGNGMNEKIKNKVPANAINNVLIRERRT